METEIQSVTRNRENALYFRFTDDELAQKRDGYGLAQYGVTGVKKWSAETFLISREKAEKTDSFFATSGVDTARDQSGTAPLFIAQKTPGNSRLEQVLTGRAFGRLQLAAESLGVRSHPICQLTEDHRDMETLKAKLKNLLGVAEGETVQMLTRLGYASPTAHAPRRDVQAMVKTAGEI
jgi:hypothetical protein